MFSNGTSQSLPNLRSYTNAVCTLTSDAYSSMGAVCLNIPGLPSINGSLGFAYGREVLQYVSRALADLFGSTHLFRTWDAEFVTLCPNTTHEVFLGRCNRLRSVLECRYPKTVRVGYTWADGVFTGKELVNEARSIMRCERVPLQYRQDCAQGATLHSARDFIRPKRFTVYLQPKVNMTDGTVTGAEALVRGLDERGRLVSSGRFIPEMEEKGLIRDLDLYVLNRTLAQLDQWRRKGLASLPVSVNFSRFTLSDPALPASVLAIQSQYPLLEPGLVEVEITESAGNVESKSLSDAMDRFHQLGLQFTLDDFGSQYANAALLTHVKFNCLKLDRTLISDLAGKTVAARCWCGIWWRFAIPAACVAWRKAWRPRHKKRCCSRLAVSMARDFSLIPRFRRKRLRKNICMGRRSNRRRPLHGRHWANSESGVSPVHCRA